MRGILAGLKAKVRCRLDRYLLSGDTGGGHLQLCMAPEVQRFEEPHEIVEHLARFFCVDRMPILILKKNSRVLN